MEMGGSDFDNTHEKSVECGDFERRNSTAKQHSLPRHNKQNSSFTAGETILLFTFKTNSNCFIFLNLEQDFKINFATFQSLQALKIPCGCGIMQYSPTHLCHANYSIDFT